MHQDHLTLALNRTLNRQAGLAFEATPAKDSVMPRAGSEVARSHEYHFTARDVLRLVCWPAAVGILFSALAIFGASAGFFPRPKPILDTDRTILIHQAEASRTASSADIILIGDSSCLMDVNARQLEQLTGKRVLNLGTLSHVSLLTQEYLLQQSLRTNTEQKTIVLLMHPESLRLASRAPYFDGVIRAYLKEVGSWDGDLTFLRATGADAFRHCLLTRAIPIPLAGAYGQHYGFNQNLWNHLTEHNGSALDPHTYQTNRPSGNPEYRLAPQLESRSRDFRTNFPPNTRLLVGITPSPFDYVYRNHSQNCREMLATWSEWLKADASLTDLPFILPPTDFATTTHLNARGVSEYTRLIAGQLAVLARE
jgi:hypothetical protein